MKKIPILILLLFCFCSAFADSSKPQPQTPQDKVWSLTRFEREFGGSDPISGWNRAIFVFNDGLMRYVVRPVGIGYTTIIPRPLIEIIENMCCNLEFPRKAITCLGTAEWGGALDETLRFLINSTVGLGGMFDPAKHWFHIYSTDSDFGRMFAVWGIDPGCTFLLPFCSFVNVRDGAGALFDYAFDGRTYIPYSSWTYVNRVIVAEDQYASAMANASDRYHIYRTVMIARRKMINDLMAYKAANAMLKKFKSPPPVVPPQEFDKTLPANAIRLKNYYPQGSLIDTFRVLYFRPEQRDDFWWMRLSCFNRDFDKNCETRQINLQGKKPYHYFFRAPDPDGVKRKKPRLVFILPGIGTRKEGSSPMALAEMYWKQGCHVVITDSAFVHEFSERVCNNTFPGCAPDDVKHMQNLFHAIIQNLKQTFQIPEETEIAFTGWSFGALHTLFLADLEKKEPKLNATQYLAIAPPVDLGYAIQQVDSFANVSLKWNKEEAKKNALNTVTTLLGINNAKKFPAEGSVFRQLDLSEEQAKYMIASMFRLTIRDLLLHKHLKSPLPGIKNNTKPENRIALLEELDNLKFRQYAAFFPAPYETLVKKASLRSIENTLRNDKKIQVIHTWDDFLINKADKQFLTNTLGNRITWFSNGGHLGNLYTSPVKAKILELMNQ
jgi:ABC-type transporter lipoprotein component MlaA